MSYEQYDNYGEKYVFTHFIERKVALSGSHIKSASVQRNPQTGVPEIHFTLDAIGKSRIAKITEKHGVDKSDPRLLTIVLNGKLIAATTIQGTEPNIQGHEKSVRGDRLIELILQEDNFPNPLNVNFYSTNSVTPLNPLLHSAHAFPPRIARIRVARVVKIPTLKWIHSLAQITGDFTFDEARAIANLLKNQFENPVQIIEVKQLK